MNTKRNFLSASLAAAALLLASPQESSALPLTFSCAGGAACNGSTYALAITNQTDLGSGDWLYELIFGVDTTGYNGSSTDYIRAIGFKNVTADITNLTMTEAPGGASNWNTFDSGVNAGGCKDAGEIGGCAEAVSTLNGGFGMPVSPSQQYLWAFTFNSTDATPAAVGHIKYEYVRAEKDKNGDFKKVGSLGSFDTPLQQLQHPQPTPPPAAAVPEPASMLLLGTGLAALAARRRKQAAA